MSSLHSLQKDASSKRARQRERRGDPQRDEELKNTWSLRNFIRHMSGLPVSNMNRILFQWSPSRRLLRGRAQGDCSLEKEKEATHLPEREWLQSARWSQRSLCGSAVPHPYIYFSSIFWFSIPQESCPFCHVWLVKWSTFFFPFKAVLSASPIWMSLCC